MFLQVLKKNRHHFSYYYLFCRTNCAYILLGLLLWYHIWRGSYFSDIFFILDSGNLLRQAPY